MARASFPDPRPQVQPNSPYGYLPYSPGAPVYQRFPGSSFEIRPYRPSPDDVPITAPVGIPSGTVGGGSGQGGAAPANGDAAPGIPTWVWIAGGVVLVGGLYFAHQRGML